MWGGAAWAVGARAGLLAAAGTLRHRRPAATRFAALAPRTRHRPASAADKLFRRTQRCARNAPIALKQTALNTCEVSVKNS